MKGQKESIGIVLAALASLWAGACGGGSSANQVVVSVTGD